MLFIPFSISLIGFKKIGPPLILASVFSLQSGHFHDCQSPEEPAKTWGHADSFRATPPGPRDPKTDGASGRGGYQNPHGPPARFGRREFRRFLRAGLYPGLCAQLLQPAQTGRASNNVRAGCRAWHNPKILGATALFRASSRRAGFFHAPAFEDRLAQGADCLERAANSADSFFR